jgi:probable addiction module antidote protein
MFAKPRFGIRMERLNAMTLKTFVYDSADYLTTEESLDDYLQGTCEDGTPAEIAHALGIVARARGITDLARKTGLTRQSLYKALSGEGNPEMATIAKVAEALGYRLSLVKARPEHQDAA